MNSSKPGAFIQLQTRVGLDKVLPFQNPYPGKSRGGLDPQTPLPSGYGHDPLHPNFLLRFDTKKKNILTQILIVCNHGPQTPGNHVDFDLPFCANPC